MRHFICSLLLMTAPATHAADARPSFECTKARDRIERAVCASPALRRLDAELSGAYREVLKHSPAEKAAQRSWIQGRAQCAKAPELETCLRESYRSRLRRIVFLLAAELASPEDAALKRRFNLLAELSPRAKSGAPPTPDDLACEYLAEDTVHAVRDLRMHYGSGQDSLYPGCPIRLAERVPAAAAWLGSLNEVTDEHGCGGTLAGAYGRNLRVAENLAVLAPRFREKRPDIPDVGRRGDRGRSPLLGEGSDPGTVYYPDLQHWSEQGVFEREAYARFRARREEARRGLAHHYRDTIRVAPSEADALADTNLERLEWYYVGSHVGQGSVQYYPSRCYESSDVDAFLRHGRIPRKVCPYQDILDGSKPTVLRRLLGLAIVVGKPVADLKKILDAGPNFQPTGALEAGVDTPLMMAADRPEVLSLLLSKGAKPNYANDFGKTALMYAVQHRNAVGVRALLGAGADVNAKTSEDARCGLNAGLRTPLMYAAWYGTPEIVEALLSAGADATARDGNSTDALGYVNRNEREKPESIAKMRVAIERAVKAAR